jgi:hypothetical protein
MCAVSVRWSLKTGSARTSLNRAGKVIVTRYASNKKVLLSRHLAAGKLAGNFPRSIHKPLKRLSNFPELDSSPGHHFCFAFQYRITLY